MCTNLAWYRMHHTIKTTRRVNYTNQVLIASLFFPSFGRWSSSSAPPDCRTSRPAWSRPLRVFSPGAGFPLWHKHSPAEPNSVQSQPFGLSVSVSLECWTETTATVFDCKTTRVKQTPRDLTSLGAGREGNQAVQTVESFGPAGSASTWGTLCQENWKRRRRRSLGLSCRRWPLNPTLSTSTTSTTPTPTATPSTAPTAARSATTPTTADSGSWTGMTRWTVSGNGHSWPQTL